MKFKTLFLGSLLALPLMPACSSAPSAETETGSSNQKISTDDIMSRAREWVNDRVPYCGGTNGGVDEICGGICHRPSAAWDGWRSDCSGFVSWVWQITDQPSTSSYVSDRGGDQGWSTISIDDLRTGDAIVTNQNGEGHIKLFNEFRGSGAIDFFEEFDCGQVAREVVQGFSRSGNTIYVSGDSRPYHPIRRNGVNNGPPPPPPPPPVAVEMAFQANTSNLWTIGDLGNADWGLGMMPGTSPSIVTLKNGGYQVAFQANTGSLWTVGTAGNADFGLGMMKGTSPSITALSNGGYEIAFQANTGNVWVAGSAGTGDWHLGMMAGTSPSITALGDSYEIAFQANTGNLWTVGAGGTGDWNLGMMKGTSPAIAALTTGGFEVAFQANTGVLWTAGHGPLDLGMMAGTSPAIVGLEGGGYEIAFQANSTSLWTTGTAGTHDWSLGMMAGTSPGIGRTPGGGYQATMQANTGNLYKAGPGGVADLGLGMMNGTSPSGT